MPDLSNATPLKTLKDWQNPAERPEVIDDLIHGVDRYNPSNTPLLEDYLYEQVREGRYDLLANLATLKLYQFNPTLTNPDVVVNILLKALVGTVAGPDFSLCLSLLRDPQSLINDIESEDETLLTTLPLLSTLHDQVRTCQFTKFWKTLNSPEASHLRETYLPEFTNFHETARHQFATSIATCFNRIPTSRLSSWLDLPSASDVAKFAEGVKWTVEGQDVVIPGNGENDVKAGVVKETVELGQLTKLVAAAAV